MEDKRKSTASDKKPKRNFTDKGEVKEKKGRFDKKNNVNSSTENFSSGNKKFSSKKTKSTESGKDNSFEKNGETKRGGSTFKKREYNDSARKGLKKKIQLVEETKYDKEPKKYKTFGKNEEETQDFASTKRRKPSGEANKKTFGQKKDRFSGEQRSFGNKDKKYGGKGKGFEKKQGQNKDNFSADNKTKREFGKKTDNYKGKGGKYSSDKAKSKNEYSHSDIPKNDEEKSGKKYSLKIIKFNEEFDGYARIGKKAFQVKDALPGEEVIAEEKQTFDTAIVCDLVKILKPSPYRVEPECEYYGKCSGCGLLHMSYEGQLSAKKEYLFKKLKDFNVEVKATVGSNMEYRNKVHFGFGKVYEKNALGFFNEENHHIVDIPDCLCHGGWYSLLHKIITRWVEESGNSIYMPREGRGCLRFAVARCFDNNISLTIVATKEPNDMGKLYENLKKYFDKVALWLNLNKEKSNKVFAGEFFHVLGEKRVEGSICGIKFGLEPSSFFQTNTEIAEKVYNYACEKIVEFGATTVIDGYSGIGITSALFAQKVNKVISIELEKSATEDGERLMAENELTNIEFRNGDLKEVLPTLNREKNTAFFVDPPRSGLGLDAIEAILDYSPENIIYMSCNPTSLARDLALITQQYNIKEVTPYDMFPGAKNVEALVILTKKEGL